MSDAKKRDKGNIIYRIGWNLCRFLFFNIRRAKVVGLENIPPTNAFIVAPNHISYIDPPIVGASCKFALNYMAKKELFSMPILGWLLPLINVFPVDRGKGDIGAVKTAIKILSDGKPLLLFPEGTRGKNRKIPKLPRMGVGYFASKLKVPVVPVRLINTDAFFSFWKPIKIIWGKPLYYPSENLLSDTSTSSSYSANKKEDYSLFTQKVIETIYNLQ